MAAPFHKMVRYARRASVSCHRNGCTAAPRQRGIFHHQESADVRKCFRNGCTAAPRQRGIFHHQDSADVKKFCMNKASTTAAAAPSTLLAKSTGCPQTFQLLVIPPQLQTTTSLRAWANFSEMKSLSMVRAASG